MRRLLLLLALLAPFILGNCTKEKDPPPPEEELPPATQTGANTFGCLVNGKPWMPGGAFLGSSKDMSYDGSFFIVKASSESERGVSSIGISSTSFHDTGNYILRHNNKMHARYVSGVEYRADSINSGEVCIDRFDKIDRIISGTFHFWAVSTENSRDTVRITKGRFDMKY